MSCPNLNISPLKEIKEEYGEDAAYLANEMLTENSFKDWYGSEVYPFVDANLRIENSIGEHFDLGKNLTSRGYTNKLTKSETVTKNKDSYGEVSKQNVADIDSILGKSKKNLNSREILSKLHPKLKDPLMEKLAYMMLNKVEGSDNVIIEELEDGQYMAFDPDTDTVHLNSNMLYDNGIDMFSSTFMHEMVHKYTANALFNPKNKREEAFKFQMTSLYNTVNKYFSKEQKEEFFRVFGEEASEAGVNVHEFVSEVMTNKKFQTAVKGIKFNVWDRFINFVTSLFGGTDSSNVYGNAVEAILNQVEKYNFSYNYNSNNQLQTSVTLYATTKEAKKETEESESNKRAKKIVDNLEDRIITLEDVAAAAIKKIDKTLNRHTLKKKETFRKNLKDLRKELVKYQKTDTLKALMLFSQRVLKQSVDVENKMKTAIEEGTINDKLLMDVQEFLGAYDLIDIIVEKLQKEPLSEHLTAELKEESIKELREIEHKRKDVLAKREELVKESVIAALSKESTLAEGKFKEKFEREANSQGLKGNQKIKYIAEKMEAAEEEIKDYSYNFFERLVNISESDLNSLESLILDPGSLNSTTIQGVVNILNRADLNTRRYTLDHRRHIAEAFIEYEKDHPEGNVSKKYDALLGKNADGTKNGKLVGEYKYEFYETLSKLNRAYGKAVAESGKNSPEAKAALKDLKSWRTKNVTKSPDGFYFPMNKWKDPNFKKLSESEKKFLDVIKASIDEADRKLPDFAKLAKSPHKFEPSWYSLPTISKSQLERVYEDKKGMVPSWIKDSLTKQADDQERNEFVDETNSDNAKSLSKLGYEETISTETGSERHGVPVFFRGNLDVSQQSFDLGTLAVMNAHMAENYKQKSLTVPTLELIKEVTKNKEVLKTEGLTKKYLINKLNKTELLKLQDKESNEYKVLKSILEDRLYGESTIDMKMSANFMGMKIDGNKVVSAVGSWTSQTMLAMNYFAGGVNIFQGKVQNFIEGVGGNVFNREELRGAEKEFWADSQSWVKDIGKPLKTSKTNLLMELYNVSGDFGALSTKFAQDNRFKALMTKDMLYSTSHVGEYYIQSTLMYSVMKSIKAMNKNKEWINAEGKVVKTEAEAATLDQMYTAKDGHIEPHPSLGFIYRKGQGASKFSEVRVSNLIKKLSADLHGQYDPQMQSILQRYAVGKLVYQLRKWLLRGMKRRWRGINTSRKSIDELRDIDRYWSEDLQQFEEGYYTTAVRFISDLTKAGKEFKLSLLSTNWQQLTDAEKANIRKITSELALYGISFISASLLMALGDDEPDEDTKNSIFSAAYLVKRTASEIGFYWNPAEFLTIMRSPAASISMIEKSIHFLGQLSDPTELYKTGRRKGEYKLVKDVEDLVPIIRQLNRHENIRESLSYIYNTH